jgi:hypothetical protein
MTRESTVSSHGLRLMSSTLALCVGLLLAAPACAPLDTDGNDNAANDNTGQVTITAEIISFKFTFPISKNDKPASVLYSVTGQTEGAIIDGFYRPMPSESPFSEPIGQDQVIAENLPAGQNRAFSFNPGDVIEGFYLVGIKITPADGSEVIEALSQATIHVQGVPSPVFRQPADPVTSVEPGDFVTISFDVRDPEDDAEWRLFYIAEGAPTDVPEDQLGTQLDTGSGNVGIYTWQIPSGLTPGRYKLGISATDSGRSVAATVASGDRELIVTEANGPAVNVLEEPIEPTPPTLTFTAPGLNDVQLFRNEDYTLRFVGDIRELGASGTIDLFYDLNRDVRDGFTLLAVDLGTDVTSFEWPDDVAEGTYFIGGQISDGINDVVTTYASGTIQVVRNITLEVTSPATVVSISPSPPGEVGDTVAVEWTTNAPIGSGTVEVVAVPVDLTGTPSGAGIQVLPPTSLTTTSALFFTSTPGLYRVTVRLRLNDGDIVEENAPELVRVSSLPTVLWLGALAEDEPAFKGAIFEGVNFEDNSGVAFAAAGDVNDDDLGDFVIVARYGKPRFVNPSGIGPGEAYLVFGDDSELVGSFNLNSVGAAVPGVVFAGIRTPQGNDETDGLSSVIALPDLDNDERPELMFGFPDVNSRGHNVSIFQDGVVDPTTLSTLEREEQFLRGAVVIVSSQNSAISLPEFADSPVIELDMVGQDFDSTVVAAVDSWFDDRLAVEEDEEGLPQCMGSCDDPATDSWLDTVIGPTAGFNTALARSYLDTYILNGNSNYVFQVFEPCTEFLTCVTPPIPAPASPLLSSRPGLSGFYPDRLGDPENPTEGPLNEPQEPFGARIIGIGVGDGFGTSATLSKLVSDEDDEGAIPDPGDIIVSAPNRTARGILLDPDPTTPPEEHGEIEGLENPPGTPSVLSSAGVAYVFELGNLWESTAGLFPPKPHQYMVGQPSHNNGAGFATRIPNIDAKRISGAANDKIENIIGIEDFNEDGLNDFAIGAPNASGGQGRVYIAFRRPSAVEGDFVLTKLQLAPTDPNRLAGILIQSNGTARLGASLATGVDFNQDGVSDLVIGAPDASGAGEVIIVFGDANLTSPGDGISVEGLLGTLTSDNRPRAVRIRGVESNGSFGFNVANAGDIDGDGLNDLLIAAPNATPRFDPDLTDGVDELTEPGIDANRDGIKDDVSGAQGVPDGAINQFDDLVNAGLVYVISSNSRLDQIRNEVDPFTIGIEQLGGGILQGFIIAGRREGDRLGGGDAGEPLEGGIQNKNGRGRSRGLAPAGDVDGDNRADFLIGAILADPRVDSSSGEDTQNAGECYLIYGSVAP